MGRLVLYILGVVGAVAFSMTMFGSGVAAAKDYYVGQTYDQAAATITEYKLTPVVGAVSGDQLALNDCIVTSSHKSTFLNSSGRNDRSTEIVLNLNCNNKVAEPGHPGNSAASPQGSQAKKDIKAADVINGNPAVCQKNKDFAKWCEVVCKRSGLCSV
jgi:hypothetical protein